MATCTAWPRSTSRDSPHWCLPPSQHMPAAPAAAAHRRHLHRHVMLPCQLSQLGGQRLRVHHHLSLGSILSTCRLGTSGRCGRRCRGAGSPRCGLCPAGQWGGASQQLAQPAGHCMRDGTERRRHIGFATAPILHHARLQVATVKTQASERCPPGVLPALDGGALEWRERLDTTVSGSGVSLAPMVPRPHWAKATVLSSTLMICAVKVEGGRHAGGH